MKRKLLLGLLLLAVISGCSKKHKIDCPIAYATSLPAPRVAFKIVDKTTNEDLFFSDNPKYTTAQIMYFLRRVDATGAVKYDTIPLTVTNKCFSAYPPLTDSAFISIAALPLDTLNRYALGKGIPNGPCSFKYLADTITFDRQTYITDTSRIFTFKK